MRYAFDMPAASSDERAVSGDFVVCHKATGSITVKVRRKENGQSFSYDMEQGQQVRLPWDFDHVEVQDRSGVANSVVLLLGFGDFRQRGDGQIVTIEEIIKPVEVQRIVETVTAEISNTVQAQITNQIAAAIVGTVGVEQAGEWVADVSVINQITAAIAGLVDVSGSGVEVTNQVNIRTLTETIKTAPQGITETRETAASSLAEASHTFTADAEVYNVPANESRRDLGIVCAAENTGAVLINGTPYERGETFALGNYTGAVQLIGNTADKIYVTEVIK